MRVAAVVQAHPLRTEMAERLAVAIGGNVVYDPEPDAPEKSPWRTYRHALEMTPDDATHRLIVQDDAIVCPHFREALPHVIAAKPDQMIALFVPGVPRQSVLAVMAACEADEPFAMLPAASWTPAVAVVWPTRIIRPALEWVDRQRWPPRFNADDEIIGRLTRHLGERVLATVPSLVQHPDVAISLLGRRNAMAGRDPARVAACYLHEDYDARSIQWAA